MDNFKKKRGPLRRGITKTLNAAEAELAKDEPDKAELKILLEKLEEILDEVKEVDENILDAMIDAEVTQADYDTEHAACEEYRDKVRRMRAKINAVINAEPEVESPVPSEVGTASSMGEARTTYKLPKIQVKKFNGDVTEWLSYWSQFEKIHEDGSLHATDKFQYLSQSITMGTRARKIVDSYPQTADNYEKVVHALKTRFGDKVLLTEVYVRQVLKLVTKNASEGKKDFCLTSMFDDLESNLRALETLGVTTEENAVFLYPMVESSLPDHVIELWQRSPSSGYDEGEEISVKDRLKSLMKFLQREVKGAERLSYVKAGLMDSIKVKDKTAPIRRHRHGGKDRHNINYLEDEVPTVAGLHTGDIERCIFCNKHNDSKDCSVAVDMSLQRKSAIIKEKRVCFHCLRPGHRADHCKAFVKCPICKGKHITLMCPSLPSHKSSKEDKSHERQEYKPTVEKLASNLACTSAVILGTLMVRTASNPSRKIRLLLDNGSQRSYIRKDLAAELGLGVCGEVEIIHSLFSGLQTKMTRHKKFKAKLKHANGHGFIDCTLLGQEVICGQLPRLRKGPWMAELHKKGIWLSDMEDDKSDIEILIGADLFGRLLTGRIYQLSCGLTALETVLGWAVTGEQKDSIQVSNYAMTVTNLQISDTTVEQLWGLETIGIQDSAEVLSKQDKEDATKKHFLRTVTRLEDGSYSVNLPWVDGKPTIPNNRTIAEKRLMTTTKKLETLGMVKEYGNLFEQWLKEDFIEEVNLNDMSGPMHYLPHRAVLKPESLTTPIRPVFDASCKTARTPSLNDCLDKGPNLMELIPSILLRFREKNIGVVSDVRKAFQMVEVKEEDRNFLRFLWWESSSEMKYKVYRHKRVVFGVNSSPFLLAAVIEHHLKSVEDSRKPIAEKLLHSLYVDNCVTSVDTKEDYEEFKKQATQLLAEAKMELRLWQCNSGEDSEVGSLTSRECGLETSSVQTAKEEEYTSVLGLRWYLKSDTLSCDFDHEEITGNITKRKILSSVQKVYDPMGFLCPTLLYPKLLLQETWASKTGWDENLQEEWRTRFEDWYKDLGFLQQIKIPRNYSEGSSYRKCWELHTFCDASKDAYAAAVFLRVKHGLQTSVQLLQAKTRVAPLKRSTIPRLELLACTIGARLGDSVTKSLQLDGVPHYYWSDSMTALSWIKRNNEWGTFVGNRVKEILKLSSAEAWFHVPGVLNPADLPSRGCSSKLLLKSRWWEGPQWLLDEREHWPAEIQTVDEDAVFEEKRKAAVLAMSVTEQEAPWYIRHSSYYQNVRRVAWMKRFLKYISGKEKTKGYLSIKEINDAEVTLIKLIQADVFPKKESVISGIRVVRDDSGVLRVKTKLLNRDDTWGFKYPILLPHSHPLVTQIIEEEHARYGHSGIQVIMGKLREKYWILQGRKAIRSVVIKCVTCRKLNAKKPVSVAAPLPNDRVKEARAFEVTGVDLAGPLFTKDKKKVWIVIFTCAVYRCVHLELVESASTDAFLEAFQRFVDRRGRPSTVHSDNGTNFVGAVTVFRSIDWDSVTKKTGLQRIQWKFNPPTAAWWGGWWERLIRTVKDLLKKMSGKAKLTYQKLSSYLCSIEACINGRPLTTVTEDPDDLIPLTPAMFLYEVPLVVSYSDLDFINAPDLRALYKQRKCVMDEFKMRFRKEYLSQLVIRQKEKESSEFKVGDVVLVGADNKKRWEWPLARIIEVLPGKDGHVRVARVKTSQGIFLRPIQRLYPLEISSSSTNPEPEQDIIPISEPASTVPVMKTRFGRSIKVPNRFMP